MPRNHKSRKRSPNKMGCMQSSTSEVSIGETHSQLTSLSKKPQPSYLILLPREIRDEIYQCVLQSPRILVVVNNELKTWNQQHCACLPLHPFGHDWSLAAQKRRQFPKNAIAISLLRACKQIYAEALPVLYVLNTVHFATGFHHYTDNSGIMKNLRHLWINANFGAMDVLRRYDSRVLEMRIHILQFRMSMFHGCGSLEDLTIGLLRSDPYDPYQTTRFGGSAASFKEVLRLDNVNKEAFRVKAALKSSKEVDVGKKREVRKILEIRGEVLEEILPKFESELREICDVLGGEIWFCSSQAVLAHWKHVGGPDSSTPKLFMSI